MDKLITWFDVETVIRGRMFAGSWPKAVVGISVFSDEVEIRIKSEEDKANVSQAEEKILLESSTKGGLFCLSPTLIIFYQNRKGGNEYFNFSGL
jgi:hypothetical protein